MPFQAINRCLMASVWWASDFRLSSLGLILVRSKRGYAVDPLPAGLSVTAQEGITLKVLGISHYHIPPLTGAQANTAHRHLLYS